MVSEVTGFAESPELIDPDVLPQWILEEDENLLVINKPGWVVCHPSKNGPWSSLVGACKAYLGVEKLHLVARLDRETSGLVLLAKNPRTARKLQMALEKRMVRKEYLAVLEGRIPMEGVRVDGPLERDGESVVYVKQRVRERPGGVSAVTYFHPVHEYEGQTLAWVYPETGRKHQIRAHAQWLGASVVGDKLYGPDPQCFLDFCEKGWTPQLAALLGFYRQALHAFQLSFDLGGEHWVFTAPLSDELIGLACDRLMLNRDDLNTAALVKRTSGLRIDYCLGGGGNRSLA